MAGTLIGGKKAAAKNLAKNPNFYRDIGKKGGANGNTGGFAANSELARIAGAKGGRHSIRGHKFIGKNEDGKLVYERVIDGAKVIVHRI